jgi:hypothetical protein
MAALGALSILVLMGAAEAWLALVALGAGGAVVVRTVGQRVGACARWCRGGNGGNGSDADSGSEAAARDADGDGDGRGDGDAELLASEAGRRAPQSDAYVALDER